MAIRTWLTSSLVRHWPNVTPGAAGPIVMDVARAERFSFQLAMRNSCPRTGRWDDDRPIEVGVSVRAPKGWNVRTRRVGYVPMVHQTLSTPADELDGCGQIPGYAPDPLFDADSIDLPANETHAFWFTVVAPRGARPGTHHITVTARPAKGKAISRRLTVRLHRVVLARRRDFPVTQWFYNDALMDYYGCDGFDRRYWSILPAYLKDMADHGEDSVYTPIITPPVNGVKRPSQLLRVRSLGGGRYSFDWRDVKRYVDLARGCGLKYFEWAHLFTQWGVEYAPPVYEGQGADEKLLWKRTTGATSKTYRGFLSQLLPRFQRFLSREKLLGRSFFHVSDEPHGDKDLANYRKSRQMLRELAPWMKVMDALSDIRFARGGLTDMPIPLISEVPDFLAEKVPCWCYFCCGPKGRYLNRFMDTPLAKIRMSGWLFYRWPIRGFLHWGYNYWYRANTRTLIDPYTLQHAGRWPMWPCGDAFVVYPGPNGPVDSIRWEIFAEGLQDYALLQTLGVERSAAALKSLRSFEDFPKTARWVSQTRRKLLQDT